MLTNKTRTLARKAFIAASALSVLLIGVLSATYLYVAWGLPSVDILKSSHGLKTMLGQYDHPETPLPPLSAIPPHTVNAFIVAQDQDFIRENPFGGGLFARQLSLRLLHAHREKYSGIEAAVLQCNIALFLSREEILDAWLATAYFGKQVWGVSSASQFYCNKPVSELNLCESAMLASLPKAPSVYNPVDHPDRAQERQRFVLAEMMRLGLASAAEVAECGQ